MTLLNNIELDNIRYTENDIKKAIMNNDPIDDVLHVIIVISNPCSYAIRYILTKEFIRRMKDEQNIILYIVELAYNDQGYYVTDMANPNHLRLRTDIPLWHKENMINIAVKKLLPSCWKACAWLDADIEFDNCGWALDTLKILNGCKDIVQLFSHTVFMDANGDTDLLITGLGFQYSKKTKRGHSIKDLNSYWHPGFAWACTRKFYEKIGGLYEYAITGDGDILMSSCFLGNYKSVLPYGASDDYKKTLQIFESKCGGARLGYVPGIIRHHYHGSINSRKYDLREQILIKNDYSPTIHLSKDSNGLLIPSSNMPSNLLTCIYNHFASKNEDESIKNSLDGNIVTQNVVKFSDDSPIDIKYELEKLFNKSLSLNCILINLKKDKHRLIASTEVLKKLSILEGTFAHLDATYWKDTVKLEHDINFVLQFLKKWNNNIPDTQVTVNDFFEPSDPNIKIQKGALGCYCSHMTSLMYGYSNFTDYTIIAEDDIHIVNTHNIKRYIGMIPNDWDIICFDAIPTDPIFIDPYYKFNIGFYHLHFYIVKNTCLETIFANMYPITDQIDIMIAKMHDKLNIYNIIDTINQRNFTSNIQNDLLLIYKTPAHKKVVDMLSNLEYIINSMINIYLPGDSHINKTITSKIIEDTIYTNIFNNDFTTEINGVIHKTKIINDDLTKCINNIVKYFTRGQNVNSIVDHLTNEIMYIIESFDHHDKLDSIYLEPLKAYSFGASSSVYLLNKSNKIVKIYNSRLRWTNDNHNDIDTIFERECELLKQSIYDVEIDADNKMIYLPYLGESLYNKFELPPNWEKQIKDLFDYFENHNICYPEFNLNNILVKDNIISFVDFGLASSGNNNKDNSNNFVKMLDTLNKKFCDVLNDNERKILYNTYMKNIRLTHKYQNNVF